MRISGLLRAAYETAVDLVLPHTCPGCGGPEPWCTGCAMTIAGRPRAVILPEAMLDHFSVTGARVPAVYALARYTGPARAAIIAGKERGRRDLPPRLGRALGRSLAALQDAGALPDDLWLVPAPTRKAAARARGGDPVTAMARAAAALLAERGRPTGVAPCLALARGTRDSVGLDPAARARNLRGAVTVDARAAAPRGAITVLIDDVLTTGATAVSSVEALSASGFPPVAMVVIAAVPALRPTVFRRGDEGSLPSGRPRWW